MLLKNGILLPLEMVVISIVLINRDGSLFCYLKHQSPKNRKEYVKEFPFIYEWSPEGWADF